MQLDSSTYADYASKSTGRKSVSGGVVMCWGLGVKLFSEKQKGVTLSTTEAEYVAMTYAVKLAIFMKYVWCFVMLEYDVPCMKVLKDNQEAVYWAKGAVTTSNSRHIDTRYRFVREFGFKGDISVQHVPSVY